MGGVSTPAPFSPPAAPVAQAAPVTPAAPVDSFVSTPPSGPGLGSYLDALGGDSSISGAGITSYLDTVPRNAAVSGGAGIASYLGTIPASNVAGGPGLTSYTDAIGGSSTSGKSFSPFSAGAPAPAAQSFSSSGSSFSGSIGAQEISFTLEADSLADLVEQMRGSGGSIKLSGSIESVSFN